jgi:hypothetical protein
MYDPARTTKATSATTGWAVWSWIANRLIVWDAGGELWKPDQLVDHIFRINEQYSPVEIGVEEDGLNEWILQPLRHAQLARNTLVPLRAMKAPRGTISFIEALTHLMRSPTPRDLGQALWYLKISQVQMSLMICQLEPVFLSGWLSTPRTD